MEAKGKIWKANLIPFWTSTKFAPEDVRTWHEPIAFQTVYSLIVYLVTLSVAQAGYIASNGRRISE
jgi:hypothetical protein